MELANIFLDILDNPQWADGALEWSDISVQSCIFKYVYSCTIFGWEYPSRRYNHAYVPIERPQESNSCTHTHPTLSYTPSNNYKHSVFSHLPTLCSLKFYSHLLRPSQSEPFADYVVHFQPKVASPKAPYIAIWTRGLSQRIPSHPWMLSASSLIA